jgi:hypothetical protein
VPNATISYRPPRAGEISRCSGDGKQRSRNEPAGRGFGNGDRLAPFHQTCGDFFCGRQQQLHGSCPCFTAELTQHAEDADLGSRKFLREVGSGMA